MKIVSWNVNGLRAILAKEFEAHIQKLNPDILCLQEIKVAPVQLETLDFLSAWPHKYFNSAVRPGYSGTAIFSKIPHAVLDAEQFSKNFPTHFSENSTAVDGKFVFPDEMINPPEGRIQVADCGVFFLVNVYTPNAGSELVRLDFRHEVWDVGFCRFMETLQSHKPVIACGDFNVAHREIDLARPDQNHQSAGFTDEEREGFSRYLERGFVDVFRQFYPDKPDCYTWWSYRMGARRRNIGWRIDYFLTSPSFSIKHIEIYTDMMGSDHAPIGVEF